jgi:hypothetical protein
MAGSRGASLPKLKVVKRNSNLLGAKFRFLIMKKEYSHICFRIKKLQKNLCQKKSLQKLIFHIFFPQKQKFVRTFVFDSCLFLLGVWLQKPFDFAS